MTLLIASAFVNTVQEAQRVADQAWKAGADALEARIDSFQGTSSDLRAFLRKQEQSHWLITCRSREEGGHFAGDVVDAGMRTLEIVEGTTASIDIELATWRASAELRRRVSKHLATDTSIKLILSAHFLERVPSDVEEVIRDALSIGLRVVVKIAYAIEHITQSLAAFDLMRAFGSRVIAIAMGEAGSWTRILAPKFGAFATFATLDQAMSTASGQYTVQQLRERFRWESINADTKFFGVAGDLIAHSLSPALFNRWFEHHGHNAVFVPLRVGQDCGGLEQFLSECQRRPWLGLRGLSVTIPHKAAALGWAGEHADPMSRAIGAANTLVLADSGPAAYNTDCHAAVDSLAAALGKNRNELAGHTVDVLGAGGSARAVCYGLCEMGCRVAVFARSAAKATDFADWGASVRNWNDRLSGQGTVLVNCTPIGLWPKIGKSPMPAYALAGKELVFDLIYRPLRTKLLIDAEAAGCKIVGGLDMFVRQAATQFALWTGMTPDTRSAFEFLQNLLCEEVRRRQSVALIGARGSGKSTVAGLLAELLGLAHIDTDEMVVSESGHTIAEIFASEAEAGFRIREHSAVRRAVELAPAVISLGGGAVLDPANMASIRTLATIVWLTARPSTLVERIESDATSVSQRPSLLSKPLLEEMEEITRVREPIYRAVADLVIDTTNVEADEVARAIAGWLKECR